ncbi:MAG: CDP-alcohol phosphatidyltransferase family protein [Gammaproteobacteria bacterium]|nr:CDP-alcohol phosphatidyltransferase family protein [Gammaproteobacteria bacterium]
MPKQDTSDRMLNISQLPNLITICRIALAPVMILLLKEQQYAASLAVFILAGVSDGLDGLIAKRFNFVSRLGSILDPLADKILLVSSYVMLTLLDQLPFWLMLTVAFRDLLIIGGYLVYTSMVGPVQMRPSWLSKVNTFMQIALVIVILAQQALHWVYRPASDALIYAVTLTTVASGLHYLWTWLVVKEVEPVKEGRG